MHWMLYIQIFANSFCIWVKISLDFWLKFKWDFCVKKTKMWKRNAGVPKTKQQSYIKRWHISKLTRSWLLRRNWRRQINRKETKKVVVIKASLHTTINFICSTCTISVTAFNDMFRFYLWSFNFELFIILLFL